MGDVTRTKRTRLADYPCALDLMSGDGGATCEGTAHKTCALASGCALLPIYEQAIADAHCADLLAEFYRCALSLAVGLGPSKFMGRALKYRNRMDECLCQAGLQ